MQLPHYLLYGCISDLKTLFGPRWTLGQELAQFPDAFCFIRSAEAPIHEELQCFI